MREFGIIPIYAAHKTKNTKCDKDKDKGKWANVKGDEKNENRTGKQRDNTWNTDNSWGKNSWKEQPKTWNGPRTPNRPTNQPRPTKTPRPL